MEPEKGITKSWMLTDSTIVHWWTDCCRLWKSLMWVVTSKVIVTRLSTHKRQTSTIQMMFIFSPLVQVPWSNTKSPNPSSMASPKRRMHAIEMAAIMIKHFAIIFGIPELILDHMLMWLSHRKAQKWNILSRTSTSFYILTLYHLERIEKARANTCISEDWIGVWFLVSKYIVDFDSFLSYAYGTFSVFKSVESIFVCSLHSRA